MCIYIYVDRTKAPDRFAKRSIHQHSVATAAFVAHHVFVNVLARSQKSRDHRLCQGLRWSKQYNACGCNSTWWLIQLSKWVITCYNPNYKWIKPTYPIYNWGYNPLTSSTRTRRGGSCLKDIYETFLIYRTCMRRAPAKPVRACTLWKWCPVSHVTFQARLHTSHFSLHSSHSTLHTALFTLHPWQSTLHTPHFTVHTSHFSLLTASFTLQISHFTLHTSHFTLHSSHCKLHTSHFKVHTSHFSLNKSISQPSCSHSNAIYEIQLQKTIALRMQPQHEATLTQPLQCDLQWLSCKTQ